MSTFVGNNVSSGDIIYAVDHNELVALIAAVLNGNIDDTNVSTLSGSKITAGSLAGSKITDASVDLGAKASTFSGWVTISDTHSYSSWDSTNKTGVVTIPSDGTTKYSAGVRYRISQATGGTKYFIITKVTSTTLTLYGGTDYTLTNETISSPAYTVVKAPFGFPLDPAKWTVSGNIGSSDRSTASSTYTSFTDTFSIPIGSWRLSLKIFGIVSTDASTSNRGAFITASSDGSTETNPKLTVNFWAKSPSAAVINVGGSATSDDTVTVSSATTFTMLGKTSSGVGSAQMLGSTIAPSTFKAVCAYL